MSSEYRETIRPVAGLKEILVKSTLSPSVAIPDGIQKIDLGIFGEESEKLLDRSLKDPQGIERGRMLYVTPEGGVLFQTKDSVGSITKDGQQTQMNISVKMAPKYINLPRPMNQDRFYAGIIHSHGTYDVPASPFDFTPLFRSVDSIGIAPMLFVVTPKLKSIYFRSNDTPQWDEETVNKKVVHWTELLRSSIQKRIQPGMSLPQIEGINAIQTYGLIRTLRDKYHLKLYSCPLHKNVAVEENT